MKIRTLILLYVSGVLALACTHSDALHASGELYTHYQEYSALVNTDNYADFDNLQRIFNTFTIQKQQDLLNAQGISQRFLLELTQSHLSFPQDLVKEYNHFEKVNGDQGCLLINGYTHSMEPIAITLSYINTTEWQIDEVQVEKLAPFNRFQHKPVCDRDQLAMIRLREMM